MSAYTPGPWHVVRIEEGLFHIHSPKAERVNPVPVATVDHHRDGHEPTRVIKSLADAHLIAAAPDMYEALDQIANIEDLSDWTNNPFNMKGCKLGIYLTPEQIGKILKALAKARGEGQ